MTVSELLKDLTLLDRDKIVVIEGPNGGWANIDFILVDSANVKLRMEKHPVFSDK